MGNSGTLKKKDSPERTFEFSKRIVKRHRIVGETPCVSRISADQLLCTGTPTDAHVDEARASRSTKNLLFKLSMACKEVRETNCRLLIGSEIVPEPKLAHLMDESIRLAAIIISIIKKSRNNLVNVEQGLYGSDTGTQVDPPIHRSPFTIHHSS